MPVLPRLAEEPAGTPAEQGAPPGAASGVATAAATPAAPPQADPASASSGAASPSEDDRWTTLGSALTASAAARAAAAKRPVSPTAGEPTAKRAAGGAFDLEVAAPAAGAGTKRSTEAPEAQDRNRACVALDEPIDYSALVTLDA